MCCSYNLMDTSWNAINPNLLECQNETLITETARVAYVSEVTCLGFRV